MSIEYKRLTENELDIFIEMRINQLREEGAKEDIDLKPALKDYYSRHMTEGTFVSWICSSISTSARDSILGNCSSCSYRWRNNCRRCPVRKDDSMTRNPIIYLFQLLTHIIRQYGIFPIQSRTNPFGRKTHIIVRLIFSLKR